MNLTVTRTRKLTPPVPLYYKGGSIVPLRSSSANTTAELRTKNFDVVIAPGLDGKASGSLYLDEGNNLAQPATSVIQFQYADGMFSMTGTFGYNPGNVSIGSITLLGSQSSAGAAYGTKARVANVNAPVPLTEAYSVKLG